MKHHSPILDAIDQICDEKNISRQSVLETIEAALAVAYRKDFGDKKHQNIKAEFNPETAQARIFDVKEVVEDELYDEYLKLKEEQERLAAEAEAAGAAAGGVPAEPPAPDGKSETALESTPADAALAEEGAVDEEGRRRFDPKSMIAHREAQALKPGASVGDEIRTELFPPAEYGRMAAQTAKQVIIQRLREAEREMTFQEFKDKVGEILTGTVQRIEGRVVLVDLGHATAIMPPGETILRERYLPGQRLKVYLVSVTSTTRGPEIVVSRSHPDMVRRLFTLEVPEVSSEAISLKAVAREAGSRTKVAVYTTEPNIDPVGSCVGQRGTRVQTIIAELGGEKIDIIQYEEDPVRFIINALSPAKVLSVKLLEPERRAIAEVKEDQLSLAIGRAGQNVRLAAKLTGWKIDIVKESSGSVTTASEKTPEAATEAAEETGAAVTAPDAAPEPTTEDESKTEPAAEPATPEIPEESPKAPSDDSASS